MKYKCFIVYFAYINILNAYQPISNEDFYDKIYLPTKHIYDNLNLTEKTFPQYSQYHNCTLDIAEINLIQELLQNYILHITNIKKYNNYHLKNENNIKNATIYSVFSAITSMLLAIPSSLINIAQISCHGYECDEKNYLSLEVKDYLGNHNVYCAQKGVDYNCLKYNYQILGIYNLLQNHQYTQGCDRKLLDSMIGENILLGTYSTHTDISCVLIFALVPYIPSLMVLLPNLYFIPKSIYSSIKLKLLKNKTLSKNNSHQNLKTAIFNDLVEKIKNNNINEVIKEIILHVLIFHEVIVEDSPTITSPLLEEYQELLKKDGYLKQLLKKLIRI